MRIKMNSKVRIITSVGDELIGTYRGIDSRGIILKNAKIIIQDGFFSKNETNTIDAHVDFYRIEAIDTIED